MTMLPLVLKLSNRPVLVVGAGRVGVGKARLLMESGARVTMIAPEHVHELPAGLATFHRRAYQPGDLLGFMLVVSATGDAHVNDLVVSEARDRGIWINVVDDPERSDYFFTAVHRSGDVVLSVSTEGASPALAREIRDRISESLPDNLADIADQLRSMRQRLHDSGLSTEGVDWRPIMRRLIDHPSAPRATDCIVGRAASQETTLTT
ncbi:MAG: bifunctional precorrin-2 dehydrogenase/sirohydrochlorin ferrochelatase [Acidimicrobiaceae bacterium]|nr:bifunctional precorrin-2 dehydrogenase/sirohydrochlorin ferrochelatase [Acidimicrobiaceae bacterium]